MFKKIRKFFSFLYSFYIAESPKIPKVTCIVETTEEHLDMLECLSTEFNMTYDEYINFLIYKQYVFYMADKEAKASQIKESEAHSL